MSVDIRIPRIVMQTWKTKDVPEKWKASVVSIKQNLVSRGWKYVMMTDEDNLNLVKTQFPWYLERYLSFEYPIQRVDAIRCIWLYLHGGVYIDLDYSLNKPIDELFVSDSKKPHEVFVVPSANVSNVMTNSFMASTPRNPFWLMYLNHTMNEYPWWVFGKHLKVMSSTGPFALTWCVDDIRQTRHPKIDITTLDSKKVVPCDVCNINKCADTGYLNTLEGQSWNGLDSRVYNYVKCNGTIVYAVLILVSLVVASYTMQ